MIVGDYNCGAEMLSPVFHVVEWYESKDYSKEQMIEELEKYRKCGVENE